MPNSVTILDPSELYRPDKKDKSFFREYSTDKDDPIQKRVRETYLKMHTHQTVDFVQEKMAQWTKFNLAELTVMEALDQLNSLVDESDPDVDMPNIIHAFQTAEMLRKAHPGLDWLHLTGLIHDMGKILALNGEPQWAVVGDTFPVGCAVADSVVYKSTSFHNNPDVTNPKYNTRLGMYEENCGLENILISWGHDEYLYRVLRNHKTCTLPEEAFYIIRFHSFYPWHTGGDYQYLCNNKDESMLQWVREFNKFDLYSKSDEDIPDYKEMVEYYQGLIDRFLPGKIKF